MIQETNKKQTQNKIEKRLDLVYDSTIAQLWEGIESIITQIDHSFKEKPENKSLSFRKDEIRQF